MYKEFSVAELLIAFVLNIEVHLHDQSLMIVAMSILSLNTISSAFTLAVTSLVGEVVTIATISTPGNLSALTDADVTLLKHIVRANSKEKTNFNFILNDFS